MRGDCLQGLAEPCAKRSAGSRSRYRDTLLNPGTRSGPEPLLSIELLEYCAIDAAILLEMTTGLGMASLCLTWKRCQQCLWVVPLTSSKRGLIWAAILMVSKFTKAIC